MSAADVVLVILWLGLTAYALFGGADFGAGLWDLLAGSAARGARQRALIEEVIAPVWEANHVWLIFALVVLWTAFPTVFAAIASTLYIPLTGAAVGIILRGSGFAFRKAVVELRLKRAFGAAFAASSVITPFFLGTVAGAVASGRVPLGNARGNLVTSWLNPTGVLAGSLAVLTSGYLAAVFLCRDAHARRAHDLADQFRRRALVIGVVTGLELMGGIAVLRADAPRLFDGLTGRALPLIAVSGIAGASSLALVFRRRHSWARVSAATGVAAVVWGWGAAQYPYMLVPSVRVDDAAAPTSVLTALIGTLAVGAVLVVPPLIALLAISQRRPSTASP